MARRSAPRASQKGVASEELEASASGAGAGAGAVAVAVGGETPIVAGAVGVGLSHGGEDFKRALGSKTERRIMGMRNEGEGWDVGIKL